MQNFVILSIVSIAVLGLFVFADVQFSEATHDDNYRDVDGTGNNIGNPTWGNAGEQLIREDGLSDYGDSASVPSGASRPSARVISNAIFSQSSSVPDTLGTTDMFWLWGQFVDHDIDLTVGADPSESFDIPVPLDDMTFVGGSVISMSRSNFDPDTGTTDPPSPIPRQQINSITSFLDASNVYGSDQDRADNLRVLPDPLTDLPVNNGKLKMDPYVDAGMLLPLNDVGEDNANAGPIDPTDLFLAGDVRANEQAALTALHTVFAREHNRLVDQLATDNPLWDGDKLYEEAKIIVEGEIQWITYHEFLPILLGSSTLDPWTVYDDTIDPQIANEFSTAAYRYGHDQISSEVERKIADGSEFIDDDGIGHLSLVQAFFNPNWIKNDGIDEILRGMATSPAESTDHKLVDELRNLLFGPPGSPGTDLAALDIQRGRDHGLIDYNSARDAYDLPPVASFSEITSDMALQGVLEEQYVSVNDIDMWVGGLSEEPEEPAPDSMLGSLFTVILKDQFERLRDGDRYWYQNRNLSDEQLNLIENSYLSDVIMRNTKINSMQGNVFLMPSSVVGGHMIPVDTTSLMLAGAQYTAVWLIPVLVSAIGFGIVILRKY